MTRKKDSQFVGIAGEFASKLMHSIRGYTISRPEPDRGEDYFAINSQTGESWDVQAKGATRQKRGCYSVKIHDDQIMSERRKNLHFAIMLFENLVCRRHIVIARPELKRLFDEGKLKVKPDCHGKRRGLTITICDKSPFLPFLDNWDSVWPMIDHSNV